MSDNARIIISIEDQGGTPSAGGARPATTTTGATTGTSNPLALGSGSLGAIPLLGMGINSPNMMAGAQNLPLTTGSPSLMAATGAQPQMAAARVMGPSPHPLMAGTNTGLMAAAMGHGLNIYRGMANVNAASPGAMSNLNPLGANMPTGLGAGGVTNGGVGVLMGMMGPMMNALAPAFAIRKQVAGIAGVAAGWATSMIPGVGPWGGAAIGGATAFGLNRLGSSFVPASAGVTAVSVVAISANAVRSMANALTAGLQDRVPYSGAMTQASVNAELRQLAFDIRDARRNGVQYGRFMDKTSSLDIAFQEMTAPLKRMIMSVLEPFMDLFRGIFKLLGSILEAVGEPLARLLALILKPLEWIGSLLEGIADGVTAMLEWIGLKGKEDGVLENLQRMLEILPNQQMRDVPGLNRQNINQRLRIPAFAGIN